MILTRTTGKSTLLGILRIPHPQFWPLCSSVQSTCASPTLGKNIKDQIIRGGGEPPTSYPDKVKSGCLDTMEAKLDTGNAPTLSRITHKDSGHTMGQMLLTRSNTTHSSHHITASRATYLKEKPPNLLS